jgi:hypothetical protein
MNILTTRERILLHNCQHFPLYASLLQNKHSMYFSPVPVWEHYFCKPLIHGEENTDFGVSY